MANARTWVAGSRPRTLVAAIVPVAVGWASAIRHSGDDFRSLMLFLALVVSVALQVGVNLANDYSDGVRGTDDKRVGPLRLVGSGLVAPRDVKRAAFLCFAVAAMAGLLIAANTSWWLIAVGAASILSAWFYTGGPRPYGYAGFGEVFVFVFFGLVATVGTAYAVTGVFDVWAFLPGSAVGILATQLLVVNNLRDIPTDGPSGKLTLAVRMGDRATRILFVTLSFVFFVIVVVSSLTERWSLIAILGLIVAWKPNRDVLRGVSGKDLVPVLGGTARFQMTAGALLAIGIAVS
jgi:1,4-dihydroxy-2-naphthoate octaprenyltransferase